MFNINLADTKLDCLPIRFTRPGAQPQNSGCLPYVFTKMPFIFSYLCSTQQINITILSAADLLAMTGNITTELRMHGPLLS